MWLNSTEIFYDEDKQVLQNAKKKIKTKLHT